MYHPAFDLGIGDEWLPKHSLAGDYNAVDTEFWQSFGAIKDSEQIDVSTSKQLVSPLEEPAAPNPKRLKPARQNYHYHSRSLVKHY